MKASAIVAALILITAFVLLCCGCAEVAAYNSRVAARSVSYDGKTVTYGVTYR